ncbi:MAG: hypothetical protein PVJ38_03260 [Candidatus Bathyarchaeota archaeon]|jgi:hypothetical protein
MDHRKGVNLILAAFIISMVILSTQVYVYRLSKRGSYSNCDYLSDYILGIKQNSEHAVTASLINISKGGDNVVLGSNLDRWRSFVAGDYQFGRCDLNYTLQDEGSYTDGVRIDWGVNGLGVSSAYADFTMNLSGRGVEADLIFSVNVTAYLDVSGYWEADSSDKWIYVDIVLRDEGGYALGSRFLVEYERQKTWYNASDAPDYSWYDYGNGTYRCIFHPFLPGSEVQVRVSVHDRRDIYVQAQQSLYDK